MILTVTPNSALDRILFIDEFRPETSMRPEKTIDKVGGKALDVSVALRAFGVDALALSFVAGDSGRRLVRLLDEYGIRHDLIWLAGESRISHVIVETRHRRHSHMTAGTLPVPPEAAAEFLRKCRTHLPSADWVVAGGSIPPGLPDDFYRIIIEIATETGKPFLLDGTGLPVQATLATPPTVLKMNWAEFTQTFETAAPTLEQLKIRAETVVRQHHLPALILTCGREGILAFTPEGSFLATAPPQQVVNAAGAGDAVSGALAWRLATGDSWPAALRWAAAVGAAAVLTEGTADCRIADIKQILPQTQVQRLQFT